MRVDLPDWRWVLLLLALGFAVGASWFAVARVGSLETRVLELQSSHQEQLRTLQQQNREETERLRGAIRSRDRMMEAYNYDLAKTLGRLGAEAPSVKVPKEVPNE